MGRLNISTSSSSSVSTKNEICGQTHDYIFDKANGLFDMLQSAKEFRPITYRLWHTTTLTKDKEK